MKSSQEIAEMEEVADLAIGRAKELLLDDEHTPDGVPVGPPRATVWALIAIDRRLAMIAAFASRNDS